MRKELVLEMAEAEREATDALNAIMSKHSLPCYLFEPIVDKIHRQLVDGRAAEILEARSRLEEVADASNE